MKQRLLILMLVAISSTISHAQNYYYVDVSNPNSGDGTLANPWNKITRAIWNVPFVSGTGQDAIVYIKRGTYNISPTDDTTRIYISGERGGSNGKYFTLKAYPGDEGLVEFTANQLTANPWDPSMMAIVSTQYVKLDGLNLSGLQNTNGFGVYLSDAKHVEIRNCIFKNMYWSTDPTQYGYADASRYIYAIHADATTDSIDIINNQFNNSALGFGNTFQSTGVGKTIVQSGNTTSGLIGFASDYYVSTTGNDTTGNGSITKPWKTLITALDRAGVYFPNGTGVLRNIPVNIFLREGTYYPTRSHYIGALRGSNNQWLSILNYPGETAILDGTNLHEKFSAFFALENTKLVRIEGLTLRNLTVDSTLKTQAPAVGVKDTRFGITIRGYSRDIQIRKNVIHDIKWTKDTAKRNYPDFNDVAGAITVLGNRDTAMKQIAIDSNLVYNIDPGFAEAVTINGYVDSFYIRDNTVHDIGNIGIVAAGHYRWVTNDPSNSVSVANNYSRHGWIMHNYVYRCLSPYAVSAGIYLDGCSNVVVQDNVSKWNGTGISLGNEQDSSSSGGHLVQLNVAKENLSAGIYYGSTNHTSMVQDCIMRWNTIKDNYYIDSFLYYKANHQKTTNLYGTITPEGKYTEVQFYRVQNSTFEENTIESESKLILGFFMMQSGMTLRYNSYYNLPQTACDMIFVQDKNNDNSISLPQDSIFYSFHQYAKRTGYDQLSQAEGEEYNPDGCGALGRGGIIQAVVPAIPNILETRVFPNPAREQIQLRLSATQTEKILIEIADMTGKIMYRHQRQINVGATGISIQAKEARLSPGLYIIKVRSAMRNDTIKVVVQ